MVERPSASAPERLPEELGGIMTRMLRLLLMSALTLGVLAPVQSQASSLDGKLDVAVETADRATGTIHVLTATLTQVSGNPASLNNQVIGFEIEGGPQDPDMGTPFAPANPSDMECVTDATGVCTATHQATSEPSTSGTAQEITAWHEESPTGTCPGGTCVAFPDDADTTEGQNESTSAGGTVEPDDTDAVAVTWYDATLNVVPETVTTPVGVAQELTITVLEAPPTTTAAKTLLANVDVEITAGPNMNLDATKSDLECNTGQATGQCAVSYTGGTTAGADTIRAHIDNNDNGTVTPATGDEQPPATGEADTTEGQNEATTPGGTAEPDRTDVVTVTRSVTTTPPPPPPPPPPPSGGCNTIVGTAKDDNLRGTGKCDRIVGKGGDDVLKGRGGNDRLIGGKGDDIAKGGPGKDKCRAETEKSC